MCIRLPLLLLWVAAASGLGLGCGGADDTDEPSGPRWTPPDQPRQVELMQGMSARWELLPHRLSVWEMTLHPLDEDRATLAVRNDGGPWGAVDTGEFDYDLAVWRSTHLATLTATVQVAIPPCPDGNPDSSCVPFEASTTVSAEAGELAHATALVAWIGGLSLSTDEYGEPPTFASDPELPYDPSHGYTTQGLGVSLGQPELVPGATDGGQGPTVVVPVRVRNLLGPADRADMNAAMPLATTWITVQVLIVGGMGAGAAVTEAEVAYTISEATYGKDTVHEHAPAEQQRVLLEGAPGVAAGVVGLRAFDFWLNVPAHHDPACEVVNEPHNFQGDPVSGPGRYVRDLTVRLLEPSYDPANGRAEVLVDLFLSNSSTFLEVGNLCLRAEGGVSMLQIDDLAAQLVHASRWSVQAPSGELVETELSW